MDKAIIILVSALPTIYEAWTDRFGESKKDKLKDTVILVIAGVLLTAIAYFLLKDWQVIAVPIFMLVWRFCCFDYIVNAFLKKYSTNHPRINIWRYSGSTADFDKLTAKVHPVLRLVIRALVLVAAVWYYATL